MRGAKSPQLLLRSGFSGCRYMNPFHIPFSVLISLNIHRNIPIFVKKYFSLNEEEECAQVKLQVRASFSALTLKKSFLTYSFSGVLRTERFYKE